MLAFPRSPSSTHPSNAVLMADRGASTPSMTTHLCQAAGQYLRAARNGTYPRSVAWCSASIWSDLVGSGLLTLETSSVQTDPDGSCRIVWMINRMITPARRLTHVGSGRSPSDRVDGRRWDALVGCRTGMPGSRLGDRSMRPGRESCGALGGGEGVGGCHVGQAGSWSRSSVAGRLIDGPLRWPSATVRGRVPAGVRQRVRAGVCDVG